jgi:hypothetical protein
LQSKYNKYLFALTVILWLSVPASAQHKLLEDSRATFLIQQSVDSIYNLNFTAADSLMAVLEKRIGDHPGNSLLRAFYLNWKFKPLKDGDDAYNKFEAYLNKAITQSESMLEKDEDDVEANFFMLAGHAFLADLYATNGKNLPALGEAKSAYKYIKIGFDQLDSNPEFYFSSGIYNYYREKYPEENPFFKPFLWFFRSGDKEKGLEMLKKGSQKASFSKAECFTYLFHIYLRYENNPEKAIQYSKTLKDKYPKNLHYTASFIENRFRMNQYDDLLVEVKKLLASDKKYYQYLGEIFYGNYLELVDKKMDEALLHYKKADEIGEQEKCRIPHYDSMMYLGMGRTYRKKNMESEAVAYFKRSVKSAEYQAYRNDAEELLKN